MIIIEYEFITKTEMATDTNCRAREYLYGHPRDVSNVEKAITRIKRFFANKKYTNQCVTFIHYNDCSGYSHETNIGRLFRFYSDNVTHVEWNGNLKDTKEELPKLTAKKIREAYLNCADYAICEELKGKDGE